MILNQKPIRCVSAVLILALTGYPSGCAVAAEGEGGDELDVRRRAVRRIPPGTIVGEDNSNGWNRLVLFAKPRVAAGAVNELPHMVREIAARFPVVVMARVSPHSAEDPPTSYKLERIGVGYATEIAGRNVIVCSEKLKELDADLGTIERIVLERNEDVLEDMVQIARSNTFVMFDVKALMLRAGAHQDTRLRHLVWISSETGKVASVVWPLMETEQGTFQLVGDSLVALPGGFQEDRIIHVSGDEVMFGIPSFRAFALARMPPGTKIQATPEIAALAAQNKYTRVSLSKLLNALRKAF